MEFISHTLMLVEEYRGSMSTYKNDITCSMMLCHRIQVIALGFQRSLRQASTYRSLPYPHLQCVGTAYVMRKMRSGSDR